MADNTLEILVKVTAGKAQSELKALSNTIGTVGKKSGGSFDTLKAKFTAMDKAMSTPEGMKMMVGIAGSVIGALTGIGLAVTKLAGDYMDYAFQVKDFGRIIGATPEEASKLIQVADDVRLSVGSMTAAMRVAIMRGIAPTVENLGKLSDAYMAIKDPIERSKFLLDTFGRGGMEMAKMMELGSKAITDMGDSIEGTARLMTEEGIKAATDYYNALDSLGEVTEELKLSLGGQLMPAITEAINYINDLRSADVELGKAVQATDKLVDDHSLTLREQRDILGQLIDKELTYDQVMKIVAGTIGLIELKTDTFTRAIEEVRNARINGIITDEKYYELLKKLITRQISLEGVTNELTSAYVWHRSVISEGMNPALRDYIRLQMFAADATGNTIPPMEELGGAVKDTSKAFLEMKGTVNRAGASLDDIVEKAANATDALGKLPKSFQLKLDFKIPDFDSVIENFFGSDKWNKAGGEAVKAAFDNVEKLIGDYKITTDQARNMFAEIYVAYQDVMVGMGEITAEQAAENIRNTLGLSLQEALALAKQVRAASQFTVDSYVFLNYIIKDPKKTGALKKRKRYGGEVIVGEDDDGAPGGQYGLDMIVPPGYKGDKFPIMASSGERVTIQTPAQQQSNSTATINNYFNITVQNDVDERQLARLITREQVRTGTR